MWSCFITTSNEPERTDLSFLDPLKIIAPVSVFSNSARCASARVVEPTLFSHLQKKIFGELETDHNAWLLLTSHPWPISKTWKRGKDRGAALGCLKLDWQIAILTRQPIQSCYRYSAGTGAATTRSIARCRRKTASEAAVLKNSSRCDNETAHWRRSSL